jgi:hypothetical protein
LLAEFLCPVELHEPGVLVSHVDAAARFYDSTGAWRDRVMNGILYSGSLIQHARSDNRTKV